MRPVSYAVCRTEPLAPFPEPMQRASLILPLCVVLSAAVSGLLVLALSVDASEPPKPGAAAPPIAPAESMPVSMAKPWFFLNGPWMPGEIMRRSCMAWLAVAALAVMVREPCA